MTSVIRSPMWFAGTLYNRIFGKAGYLKCNNFMVTHHRVPKGSLGSYVFGIIRIKPDLYLQSDENIHL